MAGKTTRATGRAAAVLEPEPEEELLLEPEEPVAEVTKRTLTTERYYEPRPTGAPKIIEGEPEKDWLEEFLSERGDARTLDLIVHHLPYYEQNGNTSTTAPGRTWVTRMKLNRDNKDTFRETVQAFLPAGGWFHFDLRDGGDLVKNGRWVEKLAAMPHQPPAVPGAPVIIQNPQVPPAPPVDPFTAAKPAMGFVKDMFGFFQAMMPAPAPAPAATNGQSETPLGEKLVGAALVKMVESDKVSPDQLMGMIGASREPGWMESPVIVEVAGKALGPGGALTVLFDAYAQRIRMQTQQAWLEAQTKARQAGLDPGQAATGAAVQAGAGEGSTAPAQIPGGAESPPQPDAPPLTDEQKMQRAYLRTASRIIDDCMEGANVHSAAESIVDLLSRYEPLRPFVDALLVMEPGKVFESFAQIAPTQEVARTVFNLAKSQLNLDWIKQLQERAKELIQEWEAENQKEEAGGA